MTQPNAYSIYLTTSTSEHPVGYVIDRVLWDGSTDWSPPDGTAAIPDPEGQHPIGSTYAPTASSTAG